MYRYRIFINGKDTGVCYDNMDDVNDYVELFDLRRDGIVIQVKRVYVNKI